MMMMTMTLLVQQREEKEVMLLGTERKRGPTSGATARELPILSHLSLKETSGTHSGKKYFLFALESNRVEIFSFNF